ncbi:MAG: OpgC domain-containing protein [Rhodospirillales bacterium]
MANETTAAHPPPAQRDIRLDFFRGVGMFIIYLAHTPNNVWTLWIPARFGFSDATEIFVFCSGVASSLAFYKVFERQGWFVGTARVGFRVWQVYWAHIGLFIAVAALLAGVDSLFELGTRYKDSLGITAFFKDPATLLPAYLTLTYVPNYFDILPMYLVILVLMPLVVTLGRINPKMAMAFVVLLWLASNFRLLDPPAEPWSDRTWFFNPFGWQLVFYTGFFIGLGWIKPPKATPLLVVGCIVFLVLTIPIAWYRARFWLDFLPILDWWRDIQPLRDKTHFGILRYLHFLALAYLAWIAAGEGGYRLLAVKRLHPLVSVIRKVGQQSLAVFLLSMFLARAAGMVLDWIGRTHLTWALVNLTGFVILALAAYAVAWFKSTPWKRQRPQATTPAGPIAGGLPGGGVEPKPLPSSPPR